MDFWVSAYLKKYQDKLDSMSLEDQLDHLGPIWFLNQEIQLNEKNELNSKSFTLSLKL